MRLRSVRRLGHNSTMPIRLTVDHPGRTARAVCSGSVSREDLENYFDAVTVAGAAPYPKLFDMADADFAITDTDMLLVAARIRAYAQSGAQAGAQSGGEPIGPVAIVAVSHKGFEQAELFAVLADADRPLLVFRTVAEAEQWLTSAPGRRPAERRARP
jgi:hypothetical protein